MYTVANLDPYFYTAEAKERLNRLGHYCEVRLNREDLMAKIHNYDALICRFSHKIDAELLASATRLKVVGTNTTGTDHIDSLALRRRGIRLFSLRDLPDVIEDINSTAELAWGLIIALLRKIVPATEGALSGLGSRENFLGSDLKGKTLGILGLGRIGKKVARYGSAFDMRVIAHTLTSDSDFHGVETYLSIEEFLSQVQILTIHLPLNQSTEGLINEKRLKALPEGAVVINTSRGGIICEDALIASLRSGHLAGAALDVYDGERGYRTPTEIVEFARRDQRLLLTPHIGGATAESWAITEFAIAEAVAAYLETL